VDFLIVMVLYVAWLDQYFSPFHYWFFATFFYGITLIYQVYYTAFDKIYHLDPLLFHDWFMLKVAFRIFVHEYDLKNFLITLTGLAFGGFCAFLLYLLCVAGSATTFGPWSWVLITISLLGGIWCVWKYEPNRFPQVVFQSQVVSMIQNFIGSRDARKQVNSLTLERMKQYNIDANVRLQVKPNIYFIVVESYGRLIFDDPKFSEQYFEYLPELEKQLRAKGWHATSGTTRSAVTGGASWISYTSMLYGLNVKGQGLYLTLFKNPHITEYDSLFNWLKRQGYETWRLSSLGGYHKMEIPYDRYSLLYGVDNWIKYFDLEYEGPEYGFGPSPPDQYAINFAAEKIAAQKSGPHAMFYITQNSHSPFHSPTEVADDWKDLRQEDHPSAQKSKFWSRPDLNLYGDAIEYQLEYLTDFILKQGCDNDIFILVGDHQPASLSIDIERHETPIHIISKDKSFVEGWKEYGLYSGIDPSRMKEPIAQEAVHWALMRRLIGEYAGGDAIMPEFLPNGIPF
jgi:phosphoglycerol transferase MdoB-like AlkP superfamily enzyme